jgi:hypothetical protein
MTLRERLCVAIAEHLLYDRNNWKPNLFSLNDLEDFAQKHEKEYWGRWNKW